MRAVKCSVAIKTDVTMRFENNIHICYNSFRKWKFQSKTNNWAKCILYKFVSITMLFQVEEVFAESYDDKDVSEPMETLPAVPEEDYSVKVRCKVLTELFCLLAARCRFTYTALRNE